MSNLQSIIGGLNLSAAGNGSASNGAIVSPAAGAAFLSQLTMDKRADLLWGKSRSGKGVNAWFAAYWMLVTYGKKTLYLTAEPGSIPMSISNAVRAGMITIFSIKGREHLLAELSAILVDGLWPVLHNGVYTFNSFNAKINTDEYGLLIVDALTSVGDEMMGWLAQPKNAAKLPMTPGKEKFYVKDDLYQGGKLVEYGGGSPTHVGFTCDRLHDWVTASANLPIQKVLWISREQRASRGEKKDKEGNIVVQGEPMYGPDLPGSAATPRVTSWFGAAYHTDMVPVGGTQDRRTDIVVPAFPLPGQPTVEQLSNIPNWEYRLYTRPHPDPRTGLMYDAGNRFAGYINSDNKALAPFIVCTEQRNPDGTYTHTGLNTVWELERVRGMESETPLRNQVDAMIAKFKKSANEADKPAVKP